MKRSDWAMDRWELAGRVMLHGYKAQQKLEDRSSPWSLAFAESKGPEFFWVTFKLVRWFKDKPSDATVLEMLQAYGCWDSVEFVGVADWEKDKKGELQPASWHWLAKRSAADQKALAMQNAP